MKLLILRACALALLCCALPRAEAVPYVTVDWTQNNWEIDLLVTLHDGPSGIMRRDLLINGVWAGGQPSVGNNPLGFSASVLPIPLTLGLQFGSNVPTYIVGGTYSGGNGSPVVITGGDWYVGDAFTLTMPTGPRPTVPETGSSVALMAAALGLVAMVHRRKNLSLPTR